MNYVWLGRFLSEPCYIEAHAFCDGTREPPARVPCTCFCHLAKRTRTMADIPGRFHRRLYKGVRFENEYGSFAGEALTRAGVEDAEVVSSEIEGNLHCPVLDIDVPMFLVPSTTPGHYHLYIDVPMSWGKYRKLLVALGDAGILEKGFVKASIQRKFSNVRVPWLKKEKYV